MVKKPAFLYRDQYDGEMVFRGDLTIEQAAEIYGALYWIEEYFSIKTPESEEVAKQWLKDNLSSSCKMYMRCGRGKNDEGEFQQLLYFYRSEFPNGHHSHGDFPTTHFKF